AAAWPVVEEVSLAIRPGETLGIVGESGSGKSTLLLALMGLVKTGLEHLGGTVSFAGRAMLGQSDSTLQSIRGGPLALVPQNAGTALTPSLRIGQQIDEDMRKAQEVGVQGTPSFYVNGQSFAGNPTVDGLSQAIDAQLARLQG
ncbi:MAG TPA: ATP-binding cassette domain-containing protein, partial [Pseudomonadota bacterium]|nr:ATP-binding cassette domain-containing protein [Pseudomonadota bacterium]